MRHAEGQRRRLLAALLAAVALPASAAGVCSQPVYLSFDTGHMGVAPLEIGRAHV